MTTQSRKWILASGIALASIGVLASTTASSAALIVIPLLRSATISPTINILPAFAPNVAPTTALSPTATGPLLGAITAPVALPGLGAK